jgi:2,4'-dihydroxyacetophenone dioxygenase
MTDTDPTAGLAAIPPELVFRPGAEAELVVPDAWDDDDPRRYLPLGEGVGSRPLWISLSKNAWCDILRAEHAGLLQRHYHPHDVFGLCISGRWRYLEHDWIATPGTFVYEAPGESHTLVVEESGEAMRTMFHVNGPLIWLDEQGEPEGIYDAYTYVDMLRAHYDEVGLGADEVDRLIRR